ncbi:sensor histidine kinase [Fodinicola acaciae]|uniref:sensor histidine kinase n=1 Tax=Fodinicola acaciae TaxID=2681555 RepID=UPI0013D65321|nr:sensor histidine kinase [Fodinicola acaciae]
MPPSRPAYRSAVAIATLYAAVVAVGIWLLTYAPTADAIGYVGGAAAIGAVSTFLGLLVARLRPANPVGALLCWIGLTPIAVAAGDTYLSVSAAGRVAEWSWLVAALQGDWVWWYVPVVLLVLFLPDGRLPSRRWRWGIAALLADALAIQLVIALDPGSYRPPYENGQPMSTVAVAGAAVLLPTLLGFLVAAAVSMVLRYRRADAVRRAQLKWFALAGGFLPATLLLCWTGYAVLGRPDEFVLVGLAATYLAVPAATTIAVLRHDLYDVDKAISAAVTYGLLTAALLAIFSAVSFAGGLILGRTSAVAAAGATALCAVALSPLRAGLQRQVDRRLYPLRRAALAALDNLRQGTNAGTARPEQLEDVLRVAMRDPSLRVGYVLPGESEFVDANGAAMPEVDGHAPIMLGGQRIGLLAGAASRELLREIAAAAALIVEVVRLRLELANALRAVESSRARLLHVGYQERRRLERDLHDGAQQRLVALGMTLRLAQRHLDDGSVEVDGLIDEAVAELGTAVAELRQIAHGLRPSSLDDGLGPALAALTRSSPVDVRVDLPPGDLPDDVVTTAYYVASEAIANAVKHAAADRIALSVGQADGCLRVRVMDDGRGGARVGPGSGLVGLTDRVAAVGGKLLVDSALGGGTTVEAVLPCAS